MALSTDKRSQGLAALGALVGRLVCWARSAPESRTLLSAVAVGAATLALLGLLLWFFLLSPYSGPADFVYNQF
ncbi:MAG: hypothetical protein LBD25_08000 [Coriobacteriales bacterium]|jgi:uncharacterized membrane protein YjfL (UPF0719 family)|nr:hypothetical protein [Coriobacteriales bacterium]